jgi:hypothetical protein
MYDCMDVTKTNVKHQKIEANHKFRLVIIKSAYPLANPIADFKHSFGYLRRFVAAYAHPRIKEMTSFSTPYYGIHIRSVIIDGAIENKNITELQSLRGYQSITTAYSTINQRKVSNVDNFVATIDSIVEREPDAKFYLSSDSALAYTKLSSLFGSRIFFVDREVKTDSKRDSENIMHALIDMINLGRSSVILASSGSSFSIVASGFSTVEGHKTVVKTVGRDFGRSVCNMYNVEYSKLGNGDNENVHVRGSEEDNGYTMSELRDYERGIFEYVKELFGFSYPTTGYADAYFFERYGSDSIDDDFGVKSVYVPFPWGVINDNDGVADAYNDVEVGSIKLRQFAKWFQTYYDGKYPHFTMMQRISPSVVSKNLKDGFAPSMPFDDWVVFDDIGAKMRGERSIPTVKLEYSIESAWLGQSGGERDDLVSYSGAKCSHVVDCVLGDILPEGWAISPCGGGGGRENGRTFDSKYSIITPGDTPINEEITECILRGR